MFLSMITISNFLLEKSKSIIISGDNHTLKIVACNNEGIYGKTEIINIVDETNKTRIKIPENNDFFIAEPTVTFVFPKDYIEIKATISSLFKEIIRTKKISNDELRKLIQEIFDNMEKEK